MDIRIYASFILLFLIGSSSTYAAIEINSNSLTPEKHSFLEPTSADYIHPCEIISRTVIDEIFGTRDIEVEMVSKQKTYPSCRYTWSDGNKQTREIGGQKMDIYTESIVMIVLPEGEMTKASYDASIKSYTDDLEELSVGDHAVWSNKRKQMTVLAGTHLFHVHVDFNPDNALNKEKAIELSNIIIESF